MYWTARFEIIACGQKRVLQVGTELIELPEPNASCQSFSTESSVRTLSPGCSGGMPFAIGMRRAGRQQ